MPPAAFPAFALAAEASFGAQAAGAASRRQVAPWPCSRTHPYAPLGKAPVAFPSRSLRTGLDGPSFESSGQVLNVPLFFSSEPRCLLSL